MTRTKWDKIDRKVMNKSQFKDWYTNELIATCDKSNKIKCNCCKITQNHKMSCRYLLCSGYECNKNGTCDVKYKILNCEKNDIYHIYRQNEHEEDLNIEKKTNHGISNLMKDLINDLIY